MGFFSAALGYNCTNCHGDEVLGNWAKYADDIPVKRTARRMIQVVNTINKDLFGGREAVTCYTCHRGSPSPKVVPSLLEQYSQPPEDDPNEVEISRRVSAAPAADEILNRYIQALGGAGRLAALTSFVGKGSYEGFDSYHGKVAFEVYAKATGQRTVIAHTQNGDSVTSYDGRNAWIVGPDKPVSVLQLVPGGDLDGIKLDSDLAFPGGLKQALTDWRTGFPTTVIDDRPVQEDESRVAVLEIGRIGAVESPGLVLFAEDLPHPALLVASDADPPVSRQVHLRLSVRADAHGVG